MKNATQGMGVRAPSGMMKRSASAAKMVKNATHKSASCSAILLRILLK